MKTIKPSVWLFNILAVLAMIGVFIYNWEIGFIVYGFCNVIALGVLIDNDNTENHLWLFLTITMLGLTGLAFAIMGLEFLVAQIVKFGDYFDKKMISLVGKLTKSSPKVTIKKAEYSKEEKTGKN
jgi:hypothetical protein